LQQASTKEKIRVFALAKSLNVTSKDLLEYCRELGYAVNNQLSSLDPEQADALTQRAQRGAKPAAAAPPPPPRPLSTPANLSNKVQNLPPARAVPRPVAPPPPPAPPTPPAAKQPAAVSPPAAPTPAPQPPVTPQAPAAPAAPVTQTQEPVTQPPAAPAAQQPPAAKPAAAAPPAQQPPAPRPAVPATPPPPVAPAATNQPPAPAQPPPPARPQEHSGRVRPLDAGGARPQNQSAPPRSSNDPRLRRPLGGAGIVRRPGTPQPPPSLRQGHGAPAGQQPPAARPGQQPPKGGQAQPPGTKMVRLTDEQIARIQQGKGGPVDIKNLLRPPTGGGPPVPQAPVGTTGEKPEDDDDDKKKKSAHAPGVVPGRDARHKERAARAADRKAREAVQVRAGQIVEVDERNRGRSRHKLAKLKKPGTIPRVGKVPIDTPITVRKLCQATGVASGQVLKRLISQGAPMNTTINSVLDNDLAEAIALDLGCELDIQKPVSAEEVLVTARQQTDNPDDLKPRAPIVTIMGHVDHGKTSLLDKIRQQYGIKSDVIATEAGGITQVIRAWRVEKDGKPITFLDTPGHEAFTKMRARGANVTDIAVIVVAADDGVMPQTEEAINHAKAAKVAMIVAINKVDMPQANVTKTRQQLYSLDVLPDNMGGDTPFVETAAPPGDRKTIGIDELLEQISVLAELRELQANPNKPAVGTCLEAHLSEREGVNATLLVQQGTLRRGDMVLCGASYGTVRAMYNDIGQPIAEAGPSVPVRVTGLDEVPDADDPFYVVDDLITAREIAEKRKARRQQAAMFVREPTKLEKLGEAKVAEVKVILKADFRGSVEAIRKELEKLEHEEVRVRLLHAAIGGITESDVQLALTSPEDTIIVGFNVVPDDKARLLAGERGIQIREYDIIYNLTNDIRSALEGKLKPQEEVIHLGRAVVRETFKISKIGTVAGCYVTQGTIERSAKVRLIREGVVVYPPQDRTASLESLKRFKEDTREVREGFECGIKIAGYDDIKVGDVIEAYRIEQKQRTLE
jgi:translation initiation factor IF-2